MVPLLSYSNDCLVASISWRLKGPTSNFYPHYSFSQIFVLMHQCFLVRFGEAFCLFFVLGFASPQRFILSCCLHSPSLLFSSSFFLLFPSFFLLFPPTSFIFLFLCSMLVCHLATPWFIMCHTCFWLLQPSLFVRITLAYYIYFLSLLFDLIVLICSTCSCHQHCFTYYCAVTCCFTNSDNSHKYLVFPLAFPFTYFCVVFFLNLHFYLVLLSPTPRVIHLYASVGAWSSKLIIFNNIQTCGSNFIRFLHCLCVHVFFFSLLRLRFIWMLVCWCVYVFCCFDSFFLCVFVCLFCLFVWLCKCVYVLICSFLYFFVVFVLI